MATILIVDDEEGIRRTYGLILRLKGYEVLEAESGLKAYELAQKHLPDLILTDINMAGGGGEALLHFIRSHPQLGAKQVVLMTGDPDSLSFRRGMEAGADDYLLKPFPLEDLVSCVEARLKRAKIHVTSVLGDLSRRQDDIENFILSAQVEMLTPTFRAWERSEYATLAIVFTDIVDFTKMCEEMKDDGMKDIQRVHFLRSRELIASYRGCEIKTMGDSIMSAFHCAADALRYALELQRDPGHPLVRIRAGMHIGPMHVLGNDVFGGTVNFAGRIISYIEGSEIWLSDKAKNDLLPLGEKYAALQWQRHDDISLKGFPGTWTLWSVAMQRGEESSSA